MALYVTRTRATYLLVSQRAVVRHLHGVTHALGVTETQKERRVFVLGFEAFTTIIRGPDTIKAYYLTGVMNRLTDILM